MKPLDGTLRVKHQCLVVPALEFEGATGEPMRGRTVFQAPGSPAQPRTGPKPWCKLDIRFGEGGVHMQPRRVGGLLFGGFRDAIGRLRKARCDLVGLRLKAHRALHLGARQRRFQRGVAQPNVVGERRGRFKGVQSTANWDRARGGQVRRIVVPSQLGFHLPKLAGKPRPSKACHGVAPTGTVLVSPHAWVKVDVVVDVVVADQKHRLHLVPTQQQRAFRRNVVESVHRRNLPRFAGVDGLVDQPLNGFQVGPSCTDLQKKPFAHPLKQGL